MAESTKAAKQPTTKKPAAKVTKPNVWEAIKKANKEMERINDKKIKNYATVAERVKGFYKVFPNGAIRRDIRFSEEDTVRVEAKVFADANNHFSLLANGFSEEVKATKGVNKSSYLENAETSAIGRALRNAGFGLQDSYSPKNIKGNNYIGVEDRIFTFRMKHPLGRIESKAVNQDGNIVLFTTKIYTGEFESSPMNYRSVGSAMENRSEGYINPSNAIENAETSAIGRALGIGGFGVGSQIASAEEIALNPDAIEDVPEANAEIEETIGEEGEKEVLAVIHKCGQDKLVNSYLKYLGVKQFRDLTVKAKEKFIGDIEAKAKEVKAAKK